MIHSPAVCQQNKMSEMLESLERRVRRRLGSEKHPEQLILALLERLKMNSITILEVQNGIQAHELVEELGLSEVEANAVCLEESLWARQYANEKESRWLDAVLATLPSHFDEGMKERVRAAILGAGILSEEQLRNMSAGDLAAAKVPLAARGWLSEKYKSPQASPPPGAFAGTTVASVNPVLVLSSPSQGKPVLPIIA